MKGAIQKAARTVLAMTLAVELAGCGEQTVVSTGQTSVSSTAAPAPSSEVLAARQKAIDGFMEAQRQAMWRRLADIEPIETTAEVAARARDGVAVARLGKSHLALEQSSMPWDDTMRDFGLTEPMKNRYLVVEADIENDPCADTDPIKSVRFLIDTGIRRLDDEVLGDFEIKKFPLYADPTYLEGVYVAFPVLSCGEVATTGLGFMAMAPSLESPITINLEEFTEDVSGRTMAEHYDALLAARESLVESGGMIR